MKSAQNFIARLCPSMPSFLPKARSPLEAPQGNQNPIASSRFLSRRKCLLSNIYIDVFFSYLSRTPFWSMAFSRVGVNTHAFPVILSVYSWYHWYSWQKLLFTSPRKRMYKKCWNGSNGKSVDCGVRFWV